MPATVTTEPGTAAGRSWGERLLTLAARARAIVGDALGVVRHRVELLPRHPEATAHSAEDRERVTAAAAPRIRTRRVARVLSGVVAGLMAVASAAGLWWAGLYRDPAPVVALLRGYDLVALLVAVPVLVGALVRACRGSARAELLAACALAYAVYHYAIYVFGTAFNALFLVHVALLGLAAVALVLALRSLDVRGLAARLHPRTPVRWVSGLLAFLAVALGGMWTYYALRFAATDAPPAESKLVLPMSAVHLGYALDLLLLVPGYATASVLLWRRAPWGYVLAIVLLGSGVGSQLDYMTALPFQVAAGVPGATALDPAEPFIATAMLAGAAALLAGLRPTAALAADPARTAAQP